MTTISNPERVPKSAVDAPPISTSPENPLSEREMEVARLLATGQSNAEIARQLVISPHTVKVHLRNIFEKLAVNSRTEASMLLVQHGWIMVPGVDLPLVSEGGERAAALPEPAPLADLPARLFPWQRAYLAGVILLCLLFLVLSNLGSGGTVRPALLSDAGRMAVGPSPMQLQPRWDMRTPLSVARSRMGAARIGEQIYVIGGEGADGVTLDTVELYDLAVNEWRSRAALPEPLANLSAATLDDQLFIAGGSRSAADGAAMVRDDFLRYDPHLNRWLEEGTLPTPLAGAQLVSDDQALYLLGGWDGKTMHDEVWRYAPTDDAGAGRAKWELVTRLPAATAFFGAALAEREIFVVGGYDGQRESSQAYAYSLADNHWRDLPPLANPRGGLSLVYDGLALFALGGGWTRPLDTLERFDPGVGVWSNFPSPFPGEWRHLAAVGYNDRLHLIGGWSGDYLNTYLQYQSTFRALLPVISTD